MEFNNRNYYAIQGFMINELNLKGAALQVYAIIYGFTQEGSWFAGSWSYLSSATCLSRRSVASTLQALVDKGLLERQEVPLVNSSISIQYRVAPLCDKMSPGGANISQVGAKIAPGGAEIAPNKMLNKMKEKEIDKSISSKKETPTRFVKPTVEEIRAYCEERNNGLNPEQIFDHYEANGWKRNGGVKVSDWKACVRTWEHNNKGRPKQKVTEEEFYF